MTLLGDVLSFSLGGLLILAGVLKLSNRADLSAVLKSLVPGLPEPLRSTLSFWLPRIEIVCGIASLLPWRPPIIGWTVCFLFVSFFLVSLWIAVTRADITCQCFGDYFRTGRGIALLRSVIFLAMAATVVAVSPQAAPLARLGELALAYFLTGVLTLETLLVHHAMTLHRNRVQGELLS